MKPGLPSDDRDVFVVRKLDKLSRSLKDMLLILEKIDKWSGLSLADRAYRYDDAGWMHEDANARQLCRIRTIHGQNVISCRVVAEAICETMQADGNTLLDGTNREPQFEVCASGRHD